jgi:hypothetical protein
LAYSFSFTEIVEPLVTLTCGSVEQASSLWAGSRRSTARSCAFESVMMLLYSL